MRRILIATALWATAGCAAEPPGQFTDDGRMQDEEAVFMHHDLGGWVRCVDEGTCWGRRIRFPAYVWWVKVRTPDGTVGWSRSPDSFGDKDACG